jgi:hypothetical protein
MTCRLAAIILYANNLEAIEFSKEINLYGYSYEKTFILFTRPSVTLMEEICHF